MDSCRSADAALQLIQKIPHSASYNYLIADAGNAYVVEVTPAKFEVRQAEKGLLIATNHYVSPLMKGEQKKVLPNSMFRYRTVESLLGGPGKNDLSGLQKILSGHHDEGVCVHYALGAPCLNSYRRFSFPIEKKRDETVQGHLPTNDWLFHNESKK